jgi:hypothetical protein
VKSKLQRKIGLISAILLFLAVLPGVLVPGIVRYKEIDLKAQWPVIVFSLSLVGYIFSIYFRTVKTSLLFFCAFVFSVLFLTNPFSSSTAWGTRLGWLFLLLLLIQGLIGIYRDEHIKAQEKGR